MNLTRVPLNTASGSLFWTKGPFDAALSLRAEGDDVDVGLDGFTPVVRPGFAVADLAGGYAVNKHIRLTARVANLTGEHYEDAFGFGEPGRTFLVGVRLSE